MVSKPILLKKGKLRVLVDSRSLDSLLSDGDQNAKTMLGYSRCEFFEFVRTPLNTNNDELKDVPALMQEYDDKGNIIGIKIVLDERRSLTAFNYRMQDVERIGKTIHGKETLSLEEKEAMILVFIQGALNRVDNDMNILVTSNEVILKNRVWFESHFPGCPLNIATVRETMEIMDLFSKYRGKYYVSSNYLCDKWGWYWFSFRSKIYNYHVGDYILDAFAARFVYLLMSIDEMGFQYYSGVTNDTKESMVYHFNYFITLTSGIFDNLAIRSKDQLNIKFKGDSIPSRISLNPKAGKEFLKGLGGANFNLRQHINGHANFIQLISNLRELIIHREMLPKLTFVLGAREWEANFTKVDKNTADLINLCGDKDQEYTPISHWGQHKIYTDCLLEPFHFSKAAATLLILFSNRYLELLGFSNFIEERKRQGKSNDFLSTMKIFKRDNLGF